MSHYTWSSPGLLGEGIAESLIFKRTEVAVGDGVLSSQRAIDTGGSSEAQGLGATDTTEAHGLLDAL